VELKRKLTPQKPRSAQLLRCELYVGKNLQKKQKHRGGELVVRFIKILEQIGTGKQGTTPPLRQWGGAPREGDQRGVSCEKINRSHAQ